MLSFSASSAQLCWHSYGKDESRAYSLHHSALSRVAYRLVESQRLKKQQLGIPPQQEDSKYYATATLAYSALACSKMGVSGSAPFHRPELYSFRASVDESFFQNSSVIRL